MTDGTKSDKALKDKAFRIASNAKYNWYQRGLASMIYKVFDKKSGSSGIKSVNNMKMNFINQLLENLTKEGFILHWKIIFGELI